MHASVTAVSWLCRALKLSQHHSRYVSASAQDHTQPGKQEVPSTSLELLQQLVYLTVVQALEVLVLLFGILGILSLLSIPESLMLCNLSSGQR